MHQKNALHTISSPLISLTFLGIVLIAANLRAPITALGPVLPEIAETFQLSATASGLINALPLLIFAVASPFVPAVTLKIGIEKTLLLSIALVLGGILCRSTIGLTGFWIGTFLIGLGIAAANVLVSPLIKRDFPKYAARAIGIYAAVMAFAAAIASGIAAPISTANGNTWRMSIGVWAILAALTLLVWWRVCSKNSEQLTSSVNNISPQNAKSIWRSRVAWYVSLFMGLHTVVFYTLIDWYPSMAMEHNISTSAAGFHLFIYQAVAIAANLSTTALIPRFRDQRVLGLMCSLFIMSGLAGLLFCPSLAVCWLILAGIGAGMSMVTCLTLFTLRAENHIQATKLSGKAQCVGYLIGASGPYLAGIIHDYSHSWWGVLFSLLALSVIQIFFAWQAGVKRFV
ncbi:CynX/NimT family MFS transporter [Alteromonas confluentis]|uniref:MFS transporter n=1 Tax=Alteromonas confluentis TaxID=1656094 RepID=A0A1E7ZAE7_9ALTE|nr:MFS transporter [Alteromonas confluentis]OFC70394.1 MFS transporter [Alteromonas confluentis]